MKSEIRPVNRLASETSPYLLQHQHNPVDWYPWGEAALTRARKEQKLILLSVGYSACHWCHVMERESFENDQIAAIMNEHFVNIKVDREERPDIDDIYMAATVAMNRGQGGWPMTVFLTPDLEPVFAGTYYPPDDRYGRPGFPRLLNAVASAWDQDRDDVASRAKEFAGQLSGSRSTSKESEIGRRELELAARGFSDQFDAQHGGFGSAPKFPPSVVIMLLLRLHRRLGEDHLLTMALKTLDGMASGGMYDHVGGGFCRYSTDERWLVPHFEKMLYDNALLTKAYLEAFQVTGSLEYRRIATETLDYVIREMTSSEGGFYSSTDADSEGVEGKFFVWSVAEIDALFSESEAALIRYYYDISEGGNWDGTNIPNTPNTADVVAARFGSTAEEVRTRMSEARAKLFQAREKRTKPHLDDKVLTAWNGLMIGAFAEAYRILRDSRYLAAATRAADFLFSNLCAADGRLLRTHRNGHSHLNAYLEDYAYLAEGLLDLYESCGERRYLDWALRLLEIVVADFTDSESGAFFHTSASHERLLFRYREGTDGATPAPNAVAASAMVRLAGHWGESKWTDRATRAINAYGGNVQQYPRAFARSLIVTDWMIDSPAELAFVGLATSQRLEEMLHVAGGVFLPNRVQAISDLTETGGLPMLEGKRIPDGGAALYVCQNFMCAAPITDVDQVERTLQSIRTNTT